MALFDVTPVLEGATSLQGKLEDAIAKSKLLLEAVEGSQSKYTGLSDEYPVLRSLKGRLAASQGPNEALSTELVKFKLDLESFVEDVFNAHDQVRKDFQLWANELERDNAKLRRERMDLANERRKLEVDRRDFDARCPAAAKEEQQITEARTVTSTDDTDEKLVIAVNNNTEHHEENEQTKSESPFGKLIPCCRCNSLSQLLKLPFLIDNLNSCYPKRLFCKKPSQKMFHLTIVF